MSNAVYSKTMKKVRNKIDVKLSFDILLNNLFLVMRRRLFKTDIKTKLYAPKNI